MTPEERQLLLKDLCPRLLYGVKVHITNEWFYDKIEPYDRRLDCDVIKSIRENRYTVKPYLRPMSSMTEEEKKEYDNLKNQLVCRVQDGNGIHYVVDIDEDSFKLYDWLNKKMFDYRGLIPMGLAIEALEGMYE